MCQDQIQWTPEEEALHVAYELSPGLRRSFTTYTAAMNDPAAAAILGVFARAWRRKQQQQVAICEETADREMP